jgi:uncharacterized protein YuzE
MEALVEDLEKLDVFYDKDADVLYISFGKPSAAEDSELNENDIIIRSVKGEIIELTVLGFSKRVSGSSLVAK